MTDNNYFKFSNSVLLVPIIAVLSIWTVYWVELQFKINFNHFGVYPRTLSGIKGVFFSPFIHGSLKHLYSNTLPLVVLSAALVYFYKPVAFKVLFYGTLLSGLITWVIGRPSYHIGASGVIYLLASFIFFKGVFAKHFRLIALSLFVVFVYGSMLWYILPIKEGISWEGHLGGFITGLFFAYFLKADIPKPKKYAWEEDSYNEEADEFLRHFDEDGNFIESTPESEPETDLDTTSPIKITYHYKENKEE
ncbi:membrane associated rhomboid family serine protease [Cellulophaga sp. RHA_52]|uniref:rhomboid family intramembrane serine protease n=1 Tax=Cellulophaga TaxID=104264 RepID=UPI00095068B2|nr:MULTISPECIES: rhomboid family intramembrane serine protease [Cellulophaga]APU10819.1 rhomboid family intramembrane serine protease [Cellulophaga lytica]TVZ10719.1 membrane associated rhomboid family serine protease [Cellulophaga sp. RHA_52]